MIGEMSFKRSRSSVVEKSLSAEEQQEKITEVKKLLGHVCEKLPEMCSDASVLRYLRARNWNVKKASKMLKESIKWRIQFRPEKIRWEDVSTEAETGKVYKANYLDKLGRTVLVMRPGFQNQNTSSTSVQIKYLVFCLENAIMYSQPDQEQMVWLIDFQGWNMSSISVKVTRETAHILQDHYPERLGLAIMYNPPKIFESFWTMVKPFIEPKTYMKVQFIYSVGPQAQKVMEQYFNMEELESSFGGKNTSIFDFKAYNERMKEEERRKWETVQSTICPSPVYTPSITSEAPSESLISELESDEDDNMPDSIPTSSNLDELDEKLQHLPLNYSDDEIINEDKIQASSSPKKEVPDLKQQQPLEGALPSNPI